jgi:muramidase (phage lysozyme)
MTQPTVVIKQVVTIPRVKAFLRALRLGEGTADIDGYRRIVGGKLFESFSDHPRERIWIERYKVYSSAAGAYQFIQATWDGLALRLDLDDFAPANQDLAAVGLIDEVGALGDVIAGRIEPAIAKCASKWASLPGSTAGQRTERLDRVLAEYAKWLEFYEQEAAGEAGAQAANDEQPLLAPTQPSQIDPVAVKTAEPKKGKTIMAPILAALWPTLIQMAPSLFKIFTDPNKSVPDRNVEAAVKVFEIAKEVTGAKSEQEAVETLKADPALQQVLQGKVEENWYQLVEVGGGFQAARAANAANVATGVPFWKQPAFMVTLLILPLVYLVVGAVVFMAGWSDEIRASVVSAVLSGVLMGITGFWLGSSSGKGRNIDTAAVEK